MIHVSPPFDPETHLYRRPDGRPYGSSVTANIRGAYLLDDSHYTDFGRERGTLVHTITELDDLNDLVEESVDEALAPYLAAWRRFRAEAGFGVAELHGQRCVERRYGDDVLDVAGTVDRIGWMTFAGKLRLTVLDIKSGAPEPWHAVQLAAYADFVQRSGEFSDITRIERVGVYLTSDGQYQVRHYTDRADLKVWQAAVTVASWRRANTPRQRRAA